jgi:hypothetical protein
MKDRIASHLPAHEPPAPGMRASDNGDDSRDDGDGAISLPQLLHKRKGQPLQLKCSEHEGLILGKKSQRSAIKSARKA